MLLELSHIPLTVYCRIVFNSSRLSELELWTLKKIEKRNYDVVWCVLYQAFHIKKNMVFLGEAEKRQQ